MTGIQVATIALAATAAVFAVLTWREGRLAEAAARRAEAARDRAGAAARRAEAARDRAGAAARRAEAARDRARPEGACMTVAPLDPLMSQPCILGRHLACPEPRCECHCHQADEPLWPSTSRMFGLLSMLRKVGGRS